MEQNCVTRLVVSRNLLLLRRNNLALLLFTNAHLNQSSIQIGLSNVSLIIFSRIDSSLVHHIFQIGASKTSSDSRNLFKVHVVAQRFILRMNLQNLLTALHIRSANDHLTVETTRSHNSWVKNIHTVSSSHHDNSLVRTKTVHFNKKLVQCLLSFIMAAAHTCTTSSSHRIDLVNKNDTWQVLLGLGKQITYTRSTDTYKHLHKVRT